MRTTRIVLEIFYEHITQTSSTNSYVKSVAAQHTDSTFVVVSAGFQTAGRGQRGNTWESEAGKNLMFSLYCQPQGIAAKAQFILSQAIALTIQEALQCHTEGITIKWPNDIYHHNRKIAGILIENTLHDAHVQACVIGVGINLNQTVFRSDAPNPVSLCQIIGRETDPISLLNSIVGRFAHHYEMIEKGETAAIVSAYHQHLFWREGWHTFSDSHGKFKACIHHIEPSGHLVLTDETQRQRTYAFKEVQFVLETNK